ncbi:hypothetical protein EQZ23_06140 [Sphingomonas sp. UV9]|uniref:hypothetical protein n=1 Tax=Sphingomonas sp. UV9 TaxID=1851410 RepID=UPI000FFC5CEF|nr:hypothetical protein [Sphingomonas sp. UV9]RXD07587.1 hypothetical protein EQZ23_06140 [Sphingomonas sp. UV9]
MLKSRIKRRTVEGAQAVAQLAAIHASIAALNDEDLLDLADIFAQETSGTIKAMAGAEMTKRSLSL